MRGAGAGKVRVKTAKGRTAQSVRWLERHLNDPYVKKAKAEGWRSRAAFKLIELDEKFHFVKGSRAVVDLGVAPGGWAQVVRKMAPKAAVVGIDLLPTDPIPGVTLFEMDFMDDKAAPATGHRGTDHLRTMGLVEAAAQFAVENLRKGGTFVAKVFAGGTDAELLAVLKKHFTTIKHAKPPASRKGSVEWYVVAQGFKGRTDDTA